MKKVFLPGMAVAFSLSIGLSNASAQYSGYNLGLAGSSYPVPATAQAGLPQYQVPATQVSNRASVLMAQNEVGTGAAGHVHIPPGNYNIGGSNSVDPYTQTLPAPIVTEQGTVQASGTTTYAPVPQPQAQMSSPPMGGSYSMGSGYPIQADTGCSTCWPQAPYSYSPVPAPVGVPTYSFGPMSNCGTSFGSCAAPQNVLSVVSPKPWIFGGNALIFSRLDDEYVRFASDSNMPSTALLTTRDVDFDHAGGFEIFGGRYFGCGRYAVVASYWSLFADAQTAQYDSMPGVNQRTNLPFTTRSMADPNVYYGLELPTSMVYPRYDGTFSQRLRRDQDFQNVEINFFSFALGGAARAGLASVPVAAGCGDCGSCGDSCGSGTCGSGACGQSSCATAASCLRGPTGACAPIYGARCSKLRFAPLMGFRWFRFDDDLEYAASMTDDMYGSTADDVYYRNNVTNDLYGFQLGGIANYCTGKRLSLLAGAKAGVFGNHITSDSFLGLNGMPATVVSPNSYNGMPYSISSSVTDVAFVGEGNIGAGFCICRGWTANVGYRMIGIGGLATAPGQVPADFGLLDDARYIHRNRSILLHGVTLGAAYNW